MSSDHTQSVRASHVNTGHGDPCGGRPRRGRQLGHPRLTVESERGESTAYGGLALAAAVSRRLGLPALIDASLNLLRSHRPYHEADHVLTHAYNLFVGGGCIEDIGNLQGSEPVRRLLGAPRIPDPTTAGDFLRRFDRRALSSLDEAVDEAQLKVWKKLSSRREALVDIDSHIHKVYGAKKEGADFSYKGTWSYHPLVLTLANTGECLRLVNRSGNVVSSEGAEEAIDETMSLLGKRFKKVILRGDSGFATQKIFDVCDRHGQGFAIVCPAAPGLVTRAESLAESAWKPFVPKQRREAGAPSDKRRKRRINRKRRTARRRGKRDLKMIRQWITEIEYRPRRAKRAYRLIIRRQKIEEHDGQGQLFDLWRYRFAITNLRDRSAESALDLTYERCDQEKIIGELQSGVAAMRMPTGSLLANGAYLRCARIAHNLKCWISILALPPETTRWEWKRFRLAFVYVAARVIRQARQTIIRFPSSHRLHEEIVRAMTRFQT